MRGDRVGRKRIDDDQIVRGLWHRAQPQASVGRDGFHGDARPGSRIGQVGEQPRILGDPDDGLVDLEEIHAHAAAGVRGQRTGAQADDTDVAEPPVGNEREDHVAERAGGMVVGGGQEVHFAARGLHAVRRRAVGQHVPVTVLNGRDLVHSEERALAFEHLAAGPDDARADEQAGGGAGEEQRGARREQQQRRRDRE